MHPSLLLGEDTHRDLADLLHAKRRLVLSGASNETAKAMLLSTILKHRPRRALLVTGKDAQCETLRHWLSFFECGNAPLVSIENDNGEIVPEALQQFLLFMNGENAGATAEPQARVSICPRGVWEAAFPLYSDLLERTIILRKGGKIDFTVVVEGLVERGYRHGEDLYLAPGEYRRTGDVFDIFPIQSGHPYRVPMGFDTVERILAVDPTDLSRTSDAGEELRILPVIYGKTAPLSAQFPGDTLLVLDDQDDLEQPIGVPMLRFTSFPETQENHVHLRYLSVLKFYTLGDFLNDIRDKLRQGWTLFVVTKRLEELRGILGEERIAHTEKR